jgi:hypothetical protein
MKPSSESRKPLFFHERALLKIEGIEAIEGGAWFETSTVDTSISK